MKKNIYSLFFFLFCVISVGQNKAQHLMNELKNRDSHYVFVVSHRGDWRNAPENSLQAIRNAIDMGVDMVEIDLKMTKDSVLILMHDKTIDRTMNGKGSPSDYTLAQLKALRLKNGIGIPTDHLVPTLEEALLLTQGKVLVNIDKGYDYFTEVYKVLQKTATTHECVIKSGHPYQRVIDEHREVLDKVFFMSVVNLDKPKSEELLNDYLTHLKPFCIEVVYREETPTVLQTLNRLRDERVGIWLNSLWSELSGGRYDDRAVEGQEPDQTWGWLVDHGARLIQTDRPEQLIRYLEQRRGVKRLIP